MTEYQDQALATIEEYAPPLIEISKFIHANPELGLEEFKSSKACMEFLEAQGFTIERNVAGLETAFAATYGSGGPAVGFLSEYDALGGIGHGCGHNLIAIAGMAAGLAVKAAIDRGLPGTVQVFGTPAEESYGGKTTMAAAGVFDHLDAAMGAHPGTIEATVPTMEGSGRSLARQEFIIEFHGKPAHAAADPYNGANALDALNLFFTGVSAFRQQTRTDARFHGIVLHGGDAANVIPHFTSTKYRARAATLEYMEQLIEQVQRIAEGAALMTGCTSNFLRTINPYYDKITNHTLARRAKTYLDELGLFMPDAKAEEPAGSTDWGNVSYVAPSLETSFPIMLGTCTWHSQTVVEASDTPLAYENTLTTAKALALTGIDVLSDPALRAEVRAEFEMGLSARGRTPVAAQ
ncbi:M20 family metallopeptidase [soil metagenome]